MSGNGAPSISIASSSRLLGASLRLLNGQPSDLTESIDDLMKLNHAADFESLENLSQAALLDVNARYVSRPAKQVILTVLNCPSGNS